jgi:hypothetical protein
VIPIRLGANLPEGIPGQNISGNPGRVYESAFEPPETPRGPTVLAPYQETSWRGGNALGVNDKLIARDRHGMMNVGSEMSGRNSGLTDPPLDGPARPSLRLINRTLNYQNGTDATAAADDLTRPYTWLGEQGSGWSSVYGGVPGLWQPYGSYAGICDGPVQGIQSVVGEGEMGDGPHKVWSGPPHGLHSQTQPDYSNTIGRYMAVPQMRAPRQDRPANSKIAGQSYGQTVQPQGEAGTIAQIPIRYRPQSSWRGN